ncbi:MAG: hypothetical protein UY70_C0005G0029 [Candidatus Kaiserbacteria bacterium GW2011_GWB1_52_6]|uniref:Uncharacterized protein n=3 Tax=Candidatus Kaiseribacteriota TaxID=1752734 RepID=A0A0G1ZUG3_9BACT|nr:MAG: hypothetical protein UY67_C0004G0024 [Candidatus Kaiserbacteria bacterium GW2011_GWA2_52_12]KKW27965.1 MAG: hypothetical protein UY70_C0005G0029 [Candidatus Kaiserbacteria bacterium GW2011_GWB1_52_6]KKW31982.1 MAG: hypothetical protein UY74_C0002G0018 [Candidatus Kaiserbacteria bacterium GW2011_GWC2_52_8b]
MIGSSNYHVHTFLTSCYPHHGKLICVLASFLRDGKVHCVVGLNAGRLYCGVQSDLGNQKTESITMGG